MRTYLVTYQYISILGAIGGLDNGLKTSYVRLSTEEKANAPTFAKHIKNDILSFGLGSLDLEILSWSLVEE